MVTSSARKGHDLPALIWLLDLASAWHQVYSRCAKYLDPVPVVGHVGG